jgi:2-hydroxychromene-2-carboxylate isomerase
MGHERFVAVANKHDAEIVFKPFDIAKVFSVSGGLPVGQRSAQRQAYRLVELQRWSAHLNKKIHLHPAFFPVAGDPSAKLLIAAQNAHGTEAALTLAEALGRAVWAEEKNIADAASLAAIADSCGLPGSQLVLDSQSESVAAAYLRNTEEAIAADVFGVPWFRINGENFWGQDRLEFVELALAAA